MVFLVHLLNIFPYIKIDSQKKCLEFLQNVSILVFGVILGYGDE